MIEQRLRQTVHEYVRACLQFGKEPILRRSLVESFLGCRAHVGDGGVNAQQGSLAHDAIARYWKECVQLGVENLSNDRVGEIAGEAFDAEPRGLSPMKRVWVRELLEKFSATHSAVLRDLLRVEHTFAASVPWPSGETNLILTGTCDRLERIDDDDPDDPPRIVRLIDYKTEMGEMDHVFQMMFYGALCCIEYPSVEVVETEIDFLMMDGFVRTARYSRAELLDFWQTTTRSLCKALDDGEQKPTGGKPCQYCALRLSCAAAMPPYRDLPESDDQAVELFGEMIRAEARVQELTSLLKAYTDGKGRFEWNGLEFGWLEPRNPAFDIPIEVPLEGGVRKMLDNTAELLSSYELNPDAHLAISICGTIRKPTRDKMLADGVAVERWGKPAFKVRNAKGE